MRIFKDLKLVEQLESGIPRILRFYDKSVFKFSDNFLRITLPKPVSVSLEGEYEVDYEIGGQDSNKIELTSRQKEVLKLIMADPGISRSQLADKLKINESAVQKHIAALKKKGWIIREGETTGYWKILNKG